MKSHDMPRNFIKFAEIPVCMRNFHILGGIPTFFVFLSVSSPPGELKNLNIPIGITRFSACGGQGTTRILQKTDFGIFAEFSGILRETVKFW